MDTPATPRSRLAKWILLLLLASGTVAGVACLAADEKAGTPSGWPLRILCIVLGLGTWFLSQALIGSRRNDPDKIGDLFHDWTAGWNDWLHAHPRATDGLLIATSLCIDCFGVFLLGTALVGPSMRPFTALLILFTLRQLSQGFCALPPPPKVIWRHPGFPSLLVTYGVSNDFFFSGHTAIAVLGAIEVASCAPAWLGCIAGVVAVLEILTVLVLRAHYMMDVIAAILAATCAWAASTWIFAQP